MFITFLTPGIKPDSERVIFQVETEKYRPTSPHLNYPPTFFLLACFLPPKYWKSVQAVLKKENISVLNAISVF